MENGSFALLEQMLPFQNIFKVFKTLIIIFSMLSKNRKWCHDLKIENEVKGQSVFI